MNIAIVVPTLNAGLLWQDWIHALKCQNLSVHTILIIDSGSSDNTRQLAIENGYKLQIINKLDFNHGATRQLGIKLLDDIEVVVFLTQDAILAKQDSLSELICAFKDETVAAAYGRQLPRSNANPIEAHGRVFNYPAISCSKSMSDLYKYGFNLIFISNSFAAYRISTLNQVGGFPADVIFGEDTCLCAKLLLAGWKVAYQAKAEVFHSHGYSICEEAKRYFDMGVLHSREHWLIEQFGEPGGQGMLFIKSELSYLLRNSPKYIPLAIIRTITKYVAYKLGRLENYLPPRLKPVLSMNKQYWHCRKSSVEG